MIPTPDQIRELLARIDSTTGPEWYEALTEEQENLLGKNLLKLAILGAAIHPEASDIFIPAEKDYGYSKRYLREPTPDVEALFQAIRDNSLALEESDAALLRARKTKEMLVKSLRELADSIEASPDVTVLSLKQTRGIRPTPVSIYSPQPTGCVPADPTTYEPDGTFSMEFSVSGLPSK